MQFKSSITGESTGSKASVNGFSGSNFTDADLLLQRARNAAYAEASQGRIGSGLTLLHEALEQEPMSHDLLSDMAALLLAAGEFDHAIGYAQRALLLVQHHGPSLYTLGFALAAKGQISPAIEVLGRLTDGGPRESLMEESPELAPLAHTELARLKSLMGPFPCAD